MNLPRAQRNFSLVELIVVISIMGLLLGISAPTFYALMTGKKVDTVARDLASNITYCRQLAVARARHVALLMPGPSSSGAPDDKLYRAYRLAFVNSNSGYSFDSWVEDSKWNWAPKGASIMEADADVGIQDSVDYAKLPDDSNYTEVDAVDLSQLGGGTTIDDVRAIVFSPSGRVRGSGLYVTVGEALYSAGIWQISKPQDLPTNKSCANQITLEVNRFTGSVTYLTPDRY